MYFLKNYIFLQKKNRQGCTTQKTELGMHQKTHFQLNPLKNQKNPEIDSKTAGTKKTLFTSLRYGTLEPRMNQETTSSMDLRRIAPVSPLSFFASC